MKRLVTQHGIQRMHNAVSGFNIVALNQGPINMNFIASDFYQQFSAFEAF